MKKLFNKKHNILRVLDIVVIFALIVSLLYFLLYFFTGTVLLKNKINTTTIIHATKINNLKELKNNRLHPGETIYFEVNSSENNLGTIYVNFIPQFEEVTHRKENYIVFRIREKNKKYLIQENKYRWGEIRSSQNFPFGFTVIPNSKNRIYSIEIFSLPGYSKNILQFSSSEPMVWTGYTYSKREIFSSGKSLFTFVFKKMISTIQAASVSGSLQNDIVKLQSLLSYFSPFFFYIVYRVSHTKKKKVINERMFYCLLVLIVVGLFNTITSNNFYTAINVAVLVSLVFISHFNSKKFYLLSFIFISTTLILAMLNPTKLSIMMDKISFWSYTFLLIGLALDIMTLKNKLYNNDK